MKDGKVDRFKVDENGLTVDGYRVLDKVCLKSMYVSRLIGFVILAVIFHFTCDYAVGTASDPDQVRFWVWILFAVIVVYNLISPVVFYKRYRYRMDEDKIEVRRGILWITHEMVPIERVHQVDVNAGPVNRMFGLANVGITTAGGKVDLQFLNEDVAESIASKLNDKIVKLLKERD